MLDQARTLLNQIAAAAPDADQKHLGNQWKALHTSLRRAQCDQMRLARAIAERNVQGVRDLIEIAAKAPPPAPRGSAYAPSVPGEAAPARSAPPPLITVRAEKPTSQQLKTALAAFKKRLKLTKLDQESRLGRSPLTSGKDSGTIAILPPSLYPKNYWEELEKQGQIKNTGGGFYELVAKAKPIKGDTPADDTAPTEEHAATE
ncbi:MAG: hypothetical protein IT438_11210 [Phycisphaerales bacterium]|nr:hypothetical protein [Phycisphaerales bacterium]